MFSGHNHVQLRGKLSVAIRAWGTGAGGSRVDLWRGDIHLEGEVPHGFGVLCLETSPITDLPPPPQSLCLWSDPSGKLNIRGALLNLKIYLFVIIIIIINF